MKEKKYYLADTGKEVKIGDTIRRTWTDGISTSSITFEITDSSIKHLIEMNIITETKPGIKECKRRITEEDVFDHLGNRLNLTPSEVNLILTGTKMVSTIAYVNIMLKEIAIILDKQYQDHIKNSEKIFTISTIDGKIHEICKAHIKSYNNFAAFRTIKDAKYACSILRHTFKAMFKN